MSIFDKVKGLFGGSQASEPGGMGNDMLSCEDALRLVHEYLDGELEAVPEQQVKQHFDMCERCYPHLHLETTFRDAVRRAATGEKAPPELKAKLIKLLAEAEAGG